MDMISCGYIRCSCDKLTKNHPIDKCTDIIAIDGLSKQVLSNHETTFNNPKSRVIFIINYARQTRFYNIDLLEQISDGRVHLDKKSIDIPTKEVYVVVFANQTPPDQITQSKVTYFLIEDNNIIQQLDIEKLKNVNMIIHIVYFNP